MLWPLTIIRAMPLIHPTAAISPGAVIGRDTAIGPFSVIEDNVQIGDGCQIASHVVIKSGTKLGPNNRIAERVVLGGLPQHVHAPDHPGQLVIAENNVIRECVTIHRALKSTDVTLIGAHNLIMVGTHIGHDCRISDHTIMVNSVMLAGHVEVHDHAYLSGAVAIHQFCRVGSYAMVGGMARVRHDVPPCITVDGETTKAVGLNLVGLRRHGFNRQEISRLKEAYRTLYCRGLTWNEICDNLHLQCTSDSVTQFLEFLVSSNRGIIGQRRSANPTTLKLHSTNPSDEKISSGRMAS